MHKIFIRMCSIVLTVIMVLMLVPATVFASYGVELKVSCERPGNAFFGNSVPTFGIALKNYNVTSCDYTVAYEVQRYELNGEITAVEQVSEQFVLSGGESIAKQFKYDAKEYGLYNLNVCVLDSYSSVVCEESINFSKVILNSEPNPHHGVCVHLVRMGDTDTELMFAKNAGFGMVRDDFTWGEYETTMGEKKLSTRQSNLLENAGKYNLDILAVVGGDNAEYNSYYDSTKSALPVDMDGFSDFVESLVTEPEFGTVKKVEIQNEPQSRYILEDGTYYYGQQNIDKLGPYYAKQLIAAGEIIRDLRPDIEIGAFSLCLTGQAKTDDFIGSVYEYFEANHDGTLPFDTITMHPYTQRTGMTIGDTVEHYKNVAAQNGFEKDNTDVWCTEYGVATGSSVSEADQASYIIKTYADMKSKSYYDDVYVYDLADDSGTFGLIKHNSNADVPYSSKFSYLAVSALNKATGDADKCTKIESETADIYKFSGLQGDVYMVCPVEDSLDYSFDEENIVFYDMLGNEIQQDECETFFAEGIPYYAAMNKEILSDNEDYFTVSGCIESAQSGKNISLTVLKDDIAFNEDMFGNIQYFQQKKTSAEGNFEFKFDLDDKNDDLTAYVVSEDDSSALEFSLIGEHKALRLYSGASEVKSLKLNLPDLQNASVLIDFKYTSAQDAHKLICAFYKDEELAHVITASGTNATDKVEYDISTAENIDYDTIKLFLFDSYAQCKPLCKAMTLSGGR